MTKQAWIEHIKGTAANPYGPGLLAPSEGGNAEAWHTVVTEHRHGDPDCPACKSRNRSRKATANRKAKHEAYLAAGLIRVRGALGGTYYE
jgi:hypothetical protein